MNSSLCLSGDYFLLNKRFLLHCFELAAEYHKTIEFEVEFNSNKYSEDGDNLHRSFDPFSSSRAIDKINMITDNDLGFIANFLGLFIFALVIAYHYVLADPKYEGN
ncbi:hypothetical protein L1987_75375 [Smallanthus sonchifolius]|uniref:Uncharacterized protein n=1 Tax=Smallanthus sonchifolius TaxID=185202 RepID=A0ACB9A4H7_9ASTR|nr:hypothetical protein L1987_75375 [Smallanthus sonchifolius]